MDMLSKLISDPEAIKNIKDMVGNVSTKQQENESTGYQSTSMPESLGFLYEFLNNQQNGELLKKINNAYTKYSDNSNPGLRLLDALKPYLSQGRTENLEKIRKAIKISNAFSELKK